MKTALSWWRTAPLALLLVSAFANAQTVAMQGMLGDKALLIVDGTAPKSLAVGETYLGVKVIATAGQHAVVEINGKRHTLRVGESPASVAGNGPLAGKIVLSAGSGGHFLTQGAINGHTVQFMVDTGATTVAMGAADAERMGLNYRAGQLVGVSTANGRTQGWLIKLASVRIAEVEVYEVEAIISSQGMPYVLLGNSFLSRFQMRRENEVMTLEKRY